MAIPAIRAADLRKSYRKGRVVALDGATLSIAPGELVAITGASGSGKSTLLHALAGLLPLDHGSTEIFGQRPVGARDWARLRAGEIGMIFQEDWLLPALTARENVQLAMQGQAGTGRQHRARAEQLLERVNAAGFSERFPRELSGGERQRVAVARGLANAPRILLADEPTGELDNANSHAIIDLIGELRDSEALTVVLVTHDENVARACPRRVVMQDGRLLQ